MPCSSGLAMRDDQAARVSAAKNGVRWFLGVAWQPYTARSVQVMSSLAPWASTLSQSPSSSSVVQAPKQMH